MTLEQLLQKFQDSSVDGSIYYVASLKRWGIRWGNLNIGSGATLDEALAQAVQSVQDGKVGPYRLSGLVPIGTVTPVGETIPVGEVTLVRKI
jgi:hypothetical protein